MFVSLASSHTSRSLGVAPVTSRSRPVCVTFPRVVSAPHLALSRPSSRCVPHPCRRRLATPVWSALRAVPGHVRNDASHRHRHVPRTVTVTPPALVTLTAPPPATPTRRPTCAQRCDRGTREHRVRNEPGQNLQATAPTQHVTRHATAPHRIPTPSRSPTTHRRPPRHASRHRTPQALATEERGSDTETPSHDHTRTRPHPRHATATHPVPPTQRPTPRPDTAPPPSRPPHRRH